MAELTTAPHLDDSALLHLVDGDASNFELDRWTKHVLACAECGERLRVLKSLHGPKPPRLRPTR